MRISDWSSDVCSRSPGLDRGAATGLLRGLCLLQQRQLDERSFPDGAGHCLPLLLRVTRTDDHLVRRLVLAGASTLGRLAPRGHRMATARSPAFTAAVRVIDRVLGDAPGQRTTALPARRSEEHTSELQSLMRI